MKNYNSIILFLITLNICLLNTTYSQVTVYNKGIQTTISSGVTLTINGNFENLVNGINGSIDNLGTIQLTGNWTNAAGNNVFISNAGIVRFFNGSSQSIAGTNTTAFYNLVIDKTANNITLGNNNNTIANLLTLNSGDIVLGANTLIMGTTSSIGGTPGSNSYIQADGTGTLRKNFNSTASFTFPLGDVSQYSPVSLTINSATFSGSGFISLNVTDLKYPDVTSSDHITRYWSINSGGFSAINYNFTTQYTDSDIIGMESMLFGELYTGAQGESFNPVNTATNLLSGSGITAVPSNMALTGSNSVVLLPVTFISFKGYIQQNGTLLQWKAATQTSNKDFTVEKSTDGRTFTAIAVIKGASNGNTVNQYSYLDPTFAPGNYYYRLRLTDADNQHSYSSVLQVNLCPDPASFIVYTASDNRLIIKKSKLNSTNIRLSVYNRSGQIIFTNKFCAANPSFNEVVNLHSKMTAGIYFVSIIDGGIIETKKIFIR